LNLFPRTSRLALQTTHTHITTKTKKLISLGFLKNSSLLEMPFKIPAKLS
jgi:hypothetical protein